MAVMTKEAVLKEYRIRELMEAARRVIGRHGFEGTTIDRVAEEAHVAKGTIYLYFSNKLLSIQGDKLTQEKNHLLFYSHWYGFFP